MEKTAAIVLAGGRGTRMGVKTPKQYIKIGGHPLIYYSLKAFQDSFVDEIILVCPEEDREFCASEIVEKYGFSKVKSVAAGGEERYNSVYNGLNAVMCIAGGANCKPCDIVFIHDGARPFINSELITRSFDAACKNHAAVVAVPSKDTVKIADESGFAKETVPRESVWLMQTPQVFDYYDIYDAYSKLIESEADLAKRGITVTDDAMVLELYSERKVKLVMGDYRNIKVTTPEDLILAESYLKEGDKC
jgi:2-C-methyl-D-erythritol 4-phosphate cytidylyltransferase